MNINSALIIQIIVFCLLVWFTVKFVWPPIAKALDDRASKIAAGLAAAERGKSDFEQAEKRVAELMAEGRDQVAEIITNAEKRASQIVEDAKKQASDEAARVTAQAKAVKGAEQILCSEINADKHAQLLGMLKQEL